MFIGYTFYLFFLNLNIFQMLGQQCDQRYSANIQQHQLSYTKKKLNTTEDAYFCLLSGCKYPANVTEA